MHVYEYMTYSLFTYRNLSQIGALALFATCEVQREGSKHDFFLRYILWNMFHDVT